MNRRQLMIGAAMLASAPSVAPGHGSTLSKAVRTMENMEPAVPRPEQDTAALKKLAD